MGLFLIIQGFFHPNHKKYFSYKIMIETKKLFYQGFLLSSITFLFLIFSNLPQNDRKRFYIFEKILHGTPKT